MTAGITNLATDEWALAREAAILLKSLGRPARAVSLWQTLLTTDSLPRELRLAWLKDAIHASKAAGDVTRAADWEKALSGLIPAAEK